MLEGAGLLGRPRASGSARYNRRDMIEEPRLTPYQPTSPTGHRCLVLAPHPDDETIGCGGTIALHRAHGDEVHVLVLTDGARGLTAAEYAGQDYAQVRRRELDSACRELGGAHVEWFGFPDRGLADHALEAEAKLLRAIEQVRPGRIYCTSPWEVSPDHTAAWRLTRRVLDRLPEKPELWGYEIWQFLLPNVLVDITETWPRKDAALSQYASQRTPIDIAEAAAHLSRLRAMTCPPSVQRAEAFFHLVAGEAASTLEERLRRELDAQGADLAALRDRAERADASAPGLVTRVARRLLRRRRA